MKHETATDRAAGHQNAPDEPRDAVNREPTDDQTASKTRARDLLESVARAERKAGEAIAGEDVPP